MDKEIVWLFDINWRCPQGGFEVINRHKNGWVTLNGHDSIRSDAVYSSEKKAYEACLEYSTRSRSSIIRRIDKKIFFARLRLKEIG